MTAINSNRAIRGPVTAVPVVAGKGVRLTADTENNRWVVEADETVLWEGAAVDGSITLSEAMSNFNEVEVWMECTETNPKPIFKFNGSVGEITAVIPKGGIGDKYLYVTAWTVSGTTISFRYTIIKGVNEGTNYKEVQIVKVVGIGRKESA